MTTFDRPSEFESEAMTKLRREMSEDPAPYNIRGTAGGPRYDPWPDEPLSVADQERLHREYRDEFKQPGEPDTVRPESEDQRIRIEALRAAAQIVAGMVTVGRMEHPEDTARFFAEQFAKWLEDG